jgi:single-stranded-DNA-specific exonuclease
VKRGFWLLKRWITGDLNLGKVNRIREELGISSLLSKALVSLGYEEIEEIREFVNPENLNFDPFSIPDMEKGAERIMTAVESGEKIAVFGDYDADGITATAVVYSYLEGMGADVTYYIPERLSEGYGMNNDAIDRLYSEGVSLIVTVDNGISSHNEIEYAKHKGIEVVITDHHKVSDELPDAYAVINPQREDSVEFKELAGVGVAFMLVSALEGDLESMLEFYSDLVMVGTLADVVPLSGINRIIVKKGIESIALRSNAGLSALLDISGSADINYQTVSFGIIPRINASGRMGSASAALRLILSEDEEEILSLSEDVDSLNRLRQETELKIFSEAKEIIEEKRLSGDSIIVVSKENWHQGVLGIVATRISEMYAKPCILFSIKGEEAIGSGRSTSEMPLYDALKECSEDLVRFGGHKFAAGMTVKTEKLHTFVEKLKKYYKEKSLSAELPVLEICDVVSKNEINIASVEELEMLKPFGNENPQPVFMLTGLTLEEIYSIGDGKHSRLKLSAG